MADYERYAASGEINSTVADQAERTAAVEGRPTGPRTASSSTSWTG